MYRLFLDPVYRTIAMTEAADVLPMLRSVARTWLANLQNRWPSTHPLGLYPSFIDGSG
jgi:hypothetical protein